MNMYVHVYTKSQLPAVWQSSDITLDSLHSGKIW